MQCYSADVLQLFTIAKTHFLTPSTFSLNCKHKTQFSSYIHKISDSSGKISLCSEPNNVFTSYTQQSKSKTQWSGIAPEKLFCF